MTTEFDGRHVAVTGSSGGLGRAVVDGLLRRGAHCHLPLRGPKTPEGLPWADHDRVHLRPGVDLTDEAAVVGFYAGLPPLWASIHLAGGFAMAAIEDTSLDELRRMMQINLETCFLCCREAVRVMGTGGGRIVNVSARPARAPAAGMSAYAVSKAAVAALTESLAAETLERDILVNAVLPSLIDTEANRAAMPDADFDRWPKPAEIAEAVCFLASPGNRLTTGALTPVYGRV